MPFYVYQCGSCRQRMEAYAEISDRERPQVCGVCGKSARRDLTAELNTRSACRGVARWPIESAAAGVHPGQVAAQQRRFPHHEFNPTTGDMIFRSPAHRRRCLKDIRMVDRSAWY